MEFTQEEIQQIKGGRSNFLAMAATYCLGTFNDNFFKQAASLIAVTIGASHLQGYAMIYLSLPFVLFSSHSGWLADRFPKRNIVIFAKFFELIAMLVGAIGVITLNMDLILAMVFIMGLQSTIFSPALNGSIPELYPEKFVITVNARLKLATSLSILFGIALAGWALDREWMETDLDFGYYLVSGIVVSVALIGALVSFGSVKRPAAGTAKPFPLFGPIESLFDIKEFYQDKILFKALISSTFFYFLSATLFAVINKLGLDELKLSQTITSVLPVALMIGISAGAFVAAKLSERYFWTRFIPLTAKLMGISLIVTGASALIFEINAVYFVSGFLILAGVFGGVFLIPVTSFIQTHPEPSSRGRTLATQNFMDFVGIIIGGFIYSQIDSMITPSQAVILLGVLSILFSIFIAFFGRKDERGGRKDERGGRKDERGGRKLEGEEK